jgi:S1-C subfamily serine protease
VGTPFDQQNDREAYRRALAARAQDALKGATFGEILNRVRAIIGDENAIEQEKMANEALGLLREGEVPSPMQLASLELVVRLMRPAPLSKGGTFEPLPKESAAAFTQWPGFQQAVREFIYSVGRINLAGGGGVAEGAAIGTGFLVADGLLVTNRHVLDELSRGTFELERGQAVVRFGYEFFSTEEEPAVDIVGVEAVHPTLDIALLRLGEAHFLTGRKPLRLATEGVEERQAVVAVGYPLNDGRNPLFISAIFGNRFGVKRSAPGVVTGVRADSFFHDCSTLGGNSGSPLLSMSDASLVGLHREGRFMYRNEAVHASALREFARPYLP